MKLWLLILCLTLVSCPAKQKENSVKNAAEYNQIILKALSGKDYKEIDCNTFYGDGMKEREAKCFVSTLERETIVEHLSSVVKDFSGGGSWIEDYGQYHASYHLSSNPAYQFGFGVSRIAYSDIVFKSHPDIWGKYESDIIFSPIVKEDQQ